MASQKSCITVFNMASTTTAYGTAALNVIMHGKSASSLFLATKKAPLYNICDIKKETRKRNKKEVMEN